ncbi:MAG: class I SAM-dependent methyltransferase [Vicinamibacterales bacterium]
MPLVLSWLPARSVVDVGCGDGAWLAEFRRHGVHHVMGLDGGHLSPAQLKIPRDAFRTCNLRNAIALPETFELAISLEVAEHLPRARGESFVADLTRLAPCVLFSAAIPFQRGTHHVNGQWPDYWQRLFESHGYVALDIIRSRIWDDEDVEFWYRQNTVLYVRASLLDGTRLAALAPQGRPRVPRLVHPALCEQWEEPSVRELLGQLPSALKSAFARRFRTLRTAGTLATVKES